MEVENAQQGRNQTFLSINSQNLRNPKKISLELMKMKMLIWLQNYQKEIMGLKDQNGKKDNLLVE